MICYPLEIVFFEVFGADAQDWLQRICSQNLIDMQLSEIRPSCFLNEKAQLIASFFIKKQEESFLIYAESEQKRAIESYFEESLFAEDVEWRISDKEMYHLFSTDGAYPYWNLEGASSLSSSSLGQVIQKKEYRWLLTRNHFLPFSDWNYDMVMEIQEFHKAISLQKGCFPGQEVLAKIDRVGRIPRVFVAYISENQLLAGEKIKSGHSSVGELRTNFSYKEKYVGMCKLLSKDLDDFVHAKKDFYVGDTQIHCISEGAL